MRVMMQEATVAKESVELQINIITQERDTLQAETQTLRARLSELAEVQQEFAALQVHDAAVSARISVMEQEHAVSLADLCYAAVFLISLIITFISK